MWICNLQVCESAIDLMLKPNNSIFSVLAEQQRGSPCGSCSSRSRPAAQSAALHRRPHLAWQIGQGTVAFESFEFAPKHWKITKIWTFPAGLVLVVVIRDRAGFIARSRASDALALCWIGTLIGSRQFENSNISRAKFKFLSAQTSSHDQRRRLIPSTDEEDQGRRRRGRVTYRTPYRSIISSLYTVISHYWFPPFRITVPIDEVITVSSSDDYWLVSLLSKSVPWIVHLTDLPLPSVPS